LSVNEDEDAELDLAAWFDFFNDVDMVHYIGSLTTTPCSEGGSGTSRLRGLSSGRRMWRMDTSATTSGLFRR